MTAYLLGVRSDRTGRALLVFGGCLAADLLLCAALRADPVWWFYTLNMLPAAMRDWSSAAAEFRRNVPDMFRENGPGDGPAGIPPSHRPEL
ncbi:hypothetical protein AB0B79_09355 [Streptomyces sp. NPDC039022]|uniref:hypothetical protein n=1 Tax=unclassified Streptomyces TaxID=2593676 RepID=UPI0033F4ADC6